MPTPKESTASKAPPSAPSASPSASPPTAEALKTPLEKNAPPAPPLIELEVWSMPAVNSRLVMCHRVGEDGSNPMNLVNVQVRTNELFLKKMRLKARPVSPDATCKSFILEGPLPRYRGRW